MQLMEIKLAMGSAIAGGSALLAQTMPVIPDDFKTWPVTAMLASLVLCSLGLCLYVMKNAFAIQQKATEALVGVSTAQKETNQKLDNVASEMRQTNLNLAGRPCIYEHGR